MKFTGNTKSKTSTKPSPPLEHGLRIVGKIHTVITYVRRIVFMTSNQISYWNYREGRRHNKAGEKLDAARIAVQRDALKETERSNKSREFLTRQANVETRRSNESREAETNRHNQVQEWLSRYSTDVNAGLHSISLELDRDKFNFTKQQYDEVERNLKQAGIDEKAVGIVISMLKLILDGAKVFKD
jgi:hypothetical protein